MLSGALIPLQPSDHEPGQRHLTQIDAGSIRWPLPVQYAPVYYEAIPPLMAQLQRLPCACPNCVNGVNAKAKGSPKKHACSYPGCGKIELRKDSSPACTHALAYGRATIYLLLAVMWQEFHSFRRTHETPANTQYERETFCVCGVLEAVHKKWPPQQAHQDAPEDAGERQTVGAAERGEENESESLYL